ncbi:MAG: hypothetical protein ACO3SR_03665 [Burkholderiaceae bacterium]
MTALTSFIVVHAARQRARRPNPTFWCSARTAHAARAVRSIGRKAI